MDLNDYWQENKRFIVSVAVGLLVFLIGTLVVSGVVDSDLQKELRTRTGYKNSLKNKARHTSADKTRAGEHNEALQAALGALGGSIAFQPRPGFQLDPAAGSASNQYYTAVDRVRGDLDILRSRHRVLLPEGIGIEPVKTNSAQTIQRHLEAVDMLERALLCAIHSGVKNVSKIRIELDPAFNSRGGLGPVERTRIQMTIVSPSGAVSDMLMMTQSDRFGQPLAIEKFEIKNARNKEDEVTAAITFLVVRLRAIELDAEGEA